MKSLAGSSTIEAGIKLNGEKEFKSAVSNVGEELRRLKTETDLVKTTFDGQANSSEALSAKQDVLTRTLETYRKKETEVRKGLDHAKESYNNVGQGLQKLYGDLENATNKLNELKLIYGESSEEVSKQQKEVDKLSTAVQRGERNYESAANRIRRWETDLNRASTETIRANRAVNENADYLREAETAANGCANSIDEFGRRARQTAGQTDQSSESIENLSNRAEQTSDSLQSTGRSVDIFGQALMANLVSGAISGAIDKLKEFATEIVKTVTELDAGAHQLQASTGASEASMIRYRDVMQDVWAGNFGESFDDIAEAMSLINRTMGELDSSTLKEMSENAITLRDTFGFDYQESIRAVDMLMSQFGLNGQQAFNLIVQGAQQGLDKNGDLLDSINEYAVHYQQLGYSADEFFNSLKNGTEAGTFSVDKLGDAMKEYGIRSKDLANTTDEAFQAMGLNAAQMRNDFAKGGTSAREATNKVLNALFSMENEVKQNAAGVNMFGTMWEDLGKDGVKALMNVEGGINSAKDAMNELKKVKYDDIGSSLKTLGRTISEKFLDPIADAVLPKIKSGIDGITAAIDPAKSQMEQFLDNVITTNKELESSAENARNVMENAQVEANTIQNLGNELLSLNDVEGKSLEQRYQLRSVVQSLSSQLPEIAEAYDQEAGKVKLTNDQIKELIENKRELLLTNAAESVEAEATANIYKAQMNMQPAKEILKAAGDKIEALKVEKKALQDIQTEYQKTGKMQKDLTPAAIEGKISGIDTEITKLTGNIDSANKEVKKSTEIIDKNTKTLDISDATKQELGIATDKLTDSEKDHTQATQESTGAESASIESLEAKKEALEAVKTKFEETKASIQQSLQQKINMFDVFDGGEDVSVEKMVENLDSQLEGIENYKTNLEIIKDQVGKTIAPEFLQYIEDMGLDGANTLKHMVATLDQDNGAELLKGMSDKYVSAMDKTEEIAKTGAANKTALEYAMGQMGSTDADFTGLRDSINEAVTSATEGWGELPVNTKTELDQAVQVAQDLGIKIPEGLAESIKSGETTPTAAIEQLNGAISGTFEGLEIVAQEAGITIPDGIKDGIASGGDSAIRAYQELIQLLQQTGVESETNAQQSGKTSADKYAESMQAQSGTVKNAGSNVAKSGIDGINSHQMEFQNTGTTAMQSMANGISGGIYLVQSKAGQAASDANNSASLYYNAFSGTGGNLALGLANGFIANSPSVVEAARAAVAKAVAAAKKEGGVASPSKVFRKEVGIHLPKGMELGIKDGTPGVARSAREMARAAIDASKKEFDVNSPSRVFIKIGKNLGEGLEIGVKGKTKAAVKASSKMAKEVYKEASSWLTTYKKTHDVTLAQEESFWRKVARTVKKGTNEYKAAVKSANSLKLFERQVNSNVDNKFGVSRTEVKNKKTVDKDEKKYYSELTKAATTYIENKKKTNKISLQQEKYFWEQVKKGAGETTQTYADASGKVKAINKKIKDGIDAENKKIEEKEKAAAEKAVSRLENSISSKKKYFSLTAAEETAMWDNLIKEAEKKGGKYLKVVQKHAKAAKKEIEQANKEYGLSGSGLDAYKTYYNVSAKAEMEYWEIVRKNRKLTNAQRIEADQKYLEAKKNYNEQMKDLEDDYYDKCKDVNEKLADDIKEATDKYNEEVADRKDAIKSAFGMFDAFKSESESKEQLLANAESQAAGYALWMQQLEELSSKGIVNDKSMEELRKMGPEAAAHIVALNSMTEEELKQINASWEKKDQIAEAQAVKENEALRKQTEENIKTMKAEAQKKLDAYKAEYDNASKVLSEAMEAPLRELANNALTLGSDATAKFIMGVGNAAKSSDATKALKGATKQLAKGLDSLPKAGKEIGKDTLAGILNGMSNKLEIKKGAKSIVAELEKAIKKEAGINSPSRRFKESVGLQIPAGVAEGVEEGAGKASRSGAKMIREMLEKSKLQLKDQQSSLADFSSKLNWSGGIEALNRIISVSPTQVQNIKVDNSGLTNTLYGMVKKIEEMGDNIRNIKLVLDTGTLVGEISRDVGNELVSFTRGIL
nr:MAG TPA: tail tape measure protein [Caudoviricetes sp.]